MERETIDRTRPSSSRKTRTSFISANRDLQTYAKYGVVIKDSDSGLKSNSPLVGILSALTHMDTEWLLCTPGDTPLLKFGWEKPLVQARSASSIICAKGLAKNTTPPPINSCE